MTSKRSRGLPRAGSGPRTTGRGRSSG
jgi:hypothetical protein